MHVIGGIILCEHSLLLPHHTQNQSHDEWISNAPTEGSYRKPICRFFLSSSNHAITCFQAWSIHGPSRLGISAFSHVLHDDGRTGEKKCVWAEDSSHSSWAIAAIAFDLGRRVSHGKPSANHCRWVLSVLGALPVALRALFIAKMAH